MTKSKGKTQKIVPDDELKQASAGQKTLCLYCKEELESADLPYCPHCGLPLRRRKRQRQITTQGGQVAKVVVDVPGAEDKEVALTKPVVTIGRHPDSMIRLDSPYISSNHALIEFSDDVHTITDLDSTNRTYLSGQPLTPDKPYRLADRDIIRFGDGRGNSIRLTYLAPTGFRWVASDRTDLVYQLEDEVSHIGRGFDAHVVLSHPAVSWYHAKVTLQGDQHIIEDVSEHSEAFLNGTQLLQPRTLAMGDVIGVGPYNLIYQGDGRLSAYIADRTFNVEAADLEKTVYPKNWLGLDDRKHPKQILSNVDIDINPREFVALIGASGGGKSTLMKALIGLSPATGGKVWINGDNLYEHLDAYRHLIGYVPQEDIIHQDLTVGRAMQYAFLLRSAGANLEEGEKQINDVLAKVGLAEHTETIVRDLSGGQRKRVSIAAELLADPWIFFLDEPTSGLDPGLEKLMMDTLRQLADEGRTIVLVTHAINHIADHCDQVVFMAQGELAYFGPPDQAMAYFNVDNFPDIYTALTLPPTNGKPSNQPDASLPQEPGWGERYRQSELYETYIVHRRGGEVARPILKKDITTGESVRRQARQFKVLAQRYFDIIKADRLSLWLLLVVMPLVALFLLIITDSNTLVGDGPEAIVAILDRSGSYTVAADTQRVLFLMALATTLLGVFGAGYELIKELPIYQRERMISLRVVPYFGSKFAVLGAFMGVQLALFLVMLALKVKLPSAGAIFWAPLEFYITLFLTVLAAVSLGLFISTLASSKDMVTYLILIAILVQIIFSGAIFKLSPLTEPLSYLTIARWSLEGLGISTDIQSLNELGQIRVEDQVSTGRGMTTVVKDVPTSIDFFVNYSRNSMALVSRWILLLAHILIWSQLAIWQIRRKDEIL